MAALTTIRNSSAPSRLTIVFSAKEALFKCLYPEVGHVFDFLDVALSNVDPANGRITFDLRRDLSAEWRRGATVPGRFAADGWTSAPASTIESCSISPPSAFATNSLPVIGGLLSSNRRLDPQPDPAAVAATRCQRPRRRS